jgi:glutamyl endopeptidase
MGNCDEEIEGNDIDDEEFISGGDDESDSNDSGEQTSDEFKHGENEGKGDVFEHGHDIRTHGGGEVEEVENFDFSNPMTERIGNKETFAVDQEFWQLPRSCDVEFGNDLPESVCGEDNRVHMTSISRIPWRMICQMIVTMFDGRKSRCTGWFISPRTVMTAGHCVFSHSKGGGWAKSIEVIPGMNSRVRPFGSATGTSFKSVRGWTGKKGKPAYDYGCIILPKSSPLGKTTGWFGFAKLSKSTLENLLANNSGYPGDKPFGTQWFNAGRVGDVEKRRFEYMLDTAGGQSGSPTWRHSNGKRHAIGIHAYGGCPNKSTRINSAVFKNMQKWKRLGS